MIKIGMFRLEFNSLVDKQQQLMFKSILEAISLERGLSNLLKFTTSSKASREKLLLMTWLQE
jgi:hypothetical protein